MARAIAARLKRLETRKHPPVQVRTGVARFMPNGQLEGELPKRPFMVMTDFGTDKEWEAKLRRQQRDLMEEAATPTTDAPFEKKRPARVPAA